MRPSGIEPEAIAWEAMILPLNQERGDRGDISLCKYFTLQLYTIDNRRFLV
jgi:hypothetical protein